ncbi:hypothetical protein [Sulfolobus islandicus rod-shaped virus 10]|uniref:Uncharacterized protein n=1 Tax=Sulfolobus islandicus rod-shaped virus 10 TaxID=1983545 RepID=A0A1X9SJR1_9VIRU|nr:hypothetical protein CCL34_gp01 [Sulfolobus islandicus rod-shaped virus 10]ARQ96468.1 hypothetical protein [Sulfolobus islandicus rod-shaped virus 10]
MSLDICKISERKMNMDEKINQILQKAKEEGEAFLVSLTPEQLRQSGFEESEDFFNFEFVKIYVLYDDQFKLKYVFNNDPSNFLYESKEDLGGLKEFIEVVKKYLEVSE